MRWALYGQSGSPPGGWTLSRGHPDLVIRAGGAEEGSRTREVGGVAAHLDKLATGCPARDTARSFDRSEFGPCDTQRTVLAKINSKTCCERCADQHCEANAPLRKVYLVVDPTSQPVDMVVEALQERALVETS